MEMSFDLVECVCDYDTKGLLEEKSLSGIKTQLANIKGERRKSSSSRSKWHVTYAKGVGRRLYTLNLKKKKVVIFMSCSDSHHKE